MSHEEKNTAMSFQGKGTGEATGAFSIRGLRVRDVRVVRQIQIQGALLRALGPQKPQICKRFALRLKIRQNEKKKSKEFVKFRVCQVCLSIHFLSTCRLLIALIALIACLAFLSFLIASQSGFDKLLHHLHLIHILYADIFLIYIHPESSDHAITFESQERITHHSSLITQLNYELHINRVLKQCSGSNQQTHQQTSRSTTKTSITNIFHQRFQTSFQMFT